MTRRIKKENRQTEEGEKREFDREEEISRGVGKGEMEGGRRRRRREVTTKKGDVNRRI